MPIHTLSRILLRVRSGASLRGCVHVYIIPFARVLMMYRRA